MRNIAVIGSGSWGVALASHLARLDNKIKMWSYSEKEADMINHERKSAYLPDAIIHENIICNTNIEEVVKDSDLIVHVTPSQFVRSTFQTYKDFVGDTPILICSKGFENSTLYTLDKVFEEELSGVKLAVLSGPSYAEEVYNQVPTALVLGSKHENLLEEVYDIFTNETVRVYLSKDMLGVEIGGSLKNIIAFCTGICVSLNMGTNTTSALITRGLVEISRLGEKMGANKETFYGLSGLGDLILTCQSDQSRNRRAGKLIGQGYNVEETKQKIGQTIESLDNIEIAKKLSEKFEVDMPIVQTAYDVLYHDLDVKKAISTLMIRDKKYE